MYSCRIVTRGYEVAARGAIPPAAFARYLEHVRWNALSSGPQPMPHITSSTRRPVIRAQRLDLYEDLGHHTEIEITAWIARVGRTSVDFAHRLLHAQDQRLLGLATATLVVLGEDGRPTPLPDDVRAAVREDVMPEAFPWPELAPPDAWTHRVPVRPSDIDLMQHVNQANYLGFCDDARLLTAAAGGYGAASTQALQRVDHVAVDHHGEARLGQTLQVSTWVLAEGADGLHLAFELRDADTQARVCRARFRISR